MNNVKTVILMGALIALMVLVGGYIDGRSGATYAFGFALLFNFATFFFSDRIVLRMYGARPLTPADAPELHTRVAALSERAGIPMPRLYLVDEPQPNAFATGRSPARAAVAVTSGLLRLMDRSELDGVLGHELAHIAHRDTLIATLAAAMSGAIMYLAHFARWGMILGSGRDDERGRSGLELLVILLLAPLAATLIQLAISRSREYAADEASARFNGNAHGLASALGKLGYASQRLPMDAAPATASLFIVNPLAGGGVLSLFSTHPPLEARIRRLRELSGLA